MLLTYQAGEQLHSLSLLPYVERVIILASEGLLPSRAEGGPRGQAPSGQVSRWRPGVLSKGDSEEPPQ